MDLHNAPEGAGEEGQPPDFAETLHRLRRRQRLTQTDLALRAGVAPGAISRLEGGKAAARPAWHCGWQTPCKPKVRIAKNFWPLPRTAGFCGVRLHNSLTGLERSTPSRGCAVRGF